MLSSILVADLSIHEPSVAGAVPDIKRRDELLFAVPPTHHSGVSVHGDNTFDPMKSIASADRRRTKRFQVDLPGTVLVNGRVHPVTISDLSSGGALLSLKVAIPAAQSADIVLTINGFGSVAAKIIRLDHWSWGVRFLNPQQHRFRLIGWLQQEVNS